MLLTLAFYIGIFLTVLGLFGLGYCITRAMALRKTGNPNGARKELSQLVAWNMASVGTAFLGLALMMVGVMLR